MGAATDGWQAARTPPGLGDVACAYFAAGVGSVGVVDTGRIVT